MPGMSASSWQPVSLDAPGTAFARLIQSFLVENPDQVRELVRGPWRSTPQVEAYYTKAAVPIGTTVDATWAGPLAAYGFQTEALALLKDVSLFEQLKPRMRRAPFKTKLPRETGSGTVAYWVGEGLSKPTTRTSYETVTLEQFKCASVTTLTNELLKLNPAAEQTVRDAVVQGVAKFIDVQFLLPTVAATPANPASITNGATAVTSTGATAAAMLTDLGAMLAAITTSGAGLHWIMKPVTAAHVAGALGANAADLPTRLFGLPVLRSANSPQQITLVDAPELLYADDGQMVMDGSRETILQSDAAPTTPPATPISLWPQNLFAVRVERWLAWRRGHDGSVVYMVTTY
jgi:HK97 family phage major capsid protein